MNAMHELRSMLCGELSEYGTKDALTMTDLDIVDKLAHAIKNIDKILDRPEVVETESYDTDYAVSKTKSRDNMNRYATMNESIMVKNLRQMMMQTQDSRKKREFENFIEKIENM